MKVTIHGPNLLDQSKGTIHVHAGDCADNTNRRKYPDQHGAWTIDAESRLEVAREVYPPHPQFDWDGTLDQAEPYLGDIWFAPCLKGWPLS